MSPFKCRGKCKVNQRAPLDNHYKIHTCTQPIITNKYGTNMAIGIVSFKRNVHGTLDILPTTRKLKTRS
jgi:hypothetical protein